MLLAIFLGLAESVAFRHSNVGFVLETHDFSLLVPAVLINVRDLPGVGDIIRMPQRKRFGYEQSGYPQEPYRDGTMPVTPTLFFLHVSSFLLDFPKKLVVESGSQCFVSAQHTVSS